MDPCVVLALGDICVAMVLTFVALLIGFVTIYPVFFVLLWRPFQIWLTRRRMWYAHKKHAEEEGYEFRPEQVSQKLSFGKHARLHLDHTSGTYRS